MPLPNPWLADVAAAAFQPPDEQGAYALAPPPEAVAPGPVASMPPPLMSSAPPIMGPMPPAEAPAPAPPNAAPPAVGPMGPPSPVTREPVDFQRDVPPGEAPLTPGPDPHAFDLMPTMGGGAPAHEVEMRGPSLLAAQDQRNAAVEGTIGAIAERNEGQAANEYGMAVSQERAARLREAAYQQSLAEQEEELAQRQADFDTTSRQLSRMGQVDPNRFWASRSTAGKIAGFAELMLAGLRNAPSMVMKRIDDDVKAQEFAYYAARDAAQAKQTAFSAAMAKYQNADAARAAARVASLDVLNAQLAQVAAQNKGNETGNQALMAMADLQNTRMQQVQQGIRFMPATAAGRYFLDPATGIVYNNKEAQAYRAKQLENAQADRQETARLGGQVLLQHDKAALEGGPDASPLTKEQRGKMEMDRIQGQRAADAFNKQMDGMLNDPVINRLGLKTAAVDKAGLVGQYADKKAASDAQHIHALNAEILNALGKIAKDNEGKPGVAMLDEYRKTFNLPMNNPALARQRIEEARELVNAFNRQQNLDVPGQGPVGTGDVPKSFKGYSK
jgi:hypothetical protein